MISYSDESKRLVSTFFEYRNDVDIYTEDEDKDKEFYKVLFSRLIDPKIKINDVTPLGSKDLVIERCKNETNNDRKKIFIVDGDVAIINGTQLNLTNLFVLDKYCIENFLIDSNSTCNFVYFNCGTKSIEQLAEDIKFDEWLNSYTESLIDLFIHFAIMNFYGGKFTLYNANKYHEHKGGSFRFNQEKVIEDINTIKEEIISNFGEDNYISKLIELKEKWGSCVDNLLTIVSGKDYLIPILLVKTQQFKSSKALPSLEEVKINLVQHCDLTKLNSLKLMIEA